MPDNGFYMYMAYALVGVLYVAYMVSLWVRGRRREPS
jgi:hypothetical protein